MGQRGGVAPNPPLFKGEIGDEAECPTTEIATPSARNDIGQGGLQ